MSLKEYIQRLNRLKEAAIARWGNTSQFDKDIFEEAYDWLIDNLEIKRGEVQPDAQLSNSMDEFIGAVNSIINNNKTFRGRLASFLQDLGTIQKNNATFHATTNNFNIQTAGVTKVQEAVTNEIINQYSGNGLNAHFAAPLRDGIYRNILAGANMKEIKQVLQAHIISGQDESGKLGQYLTQTAQQAADSYTGALNQEIAKEFTFTGYVISGSIISTSSKQCIYAIDTSEEGYLTFKDWEKVLEMARNNPKAKLIDGTTIENLPLNKLHWGCRHDFTPIIIN